MYTEQVEYEEWTMELNALLDEDACLAGNLANAAAFLYWRMGNVNWAGFYLLRRGELQLGPFTGKPACVRIALGRGVCGLAARENRILRVADVGSFPGHIACDGDSRSEIVLPLRGPDGTARGVLDLDSPREGRFTEEDENFLAGAVLLLEKRLLERMGTEWVL